MKLLRMSTAGAMAVIVGCGSGGDSSPPAGQSLLSEPEIPVMATLKALDAWTGTRFAFGTAPNGVVIRLDISASRTGDATFNGLPAVRYLGVVRLSSVAGATQTSTSVFVSPADGLMLGFESSNDLRGNVVERASVPVGARAPGSGPYRRLALVSGAGAPVGTQVDAWSLRTQGGRSEALLCVTSRVEQPAATISPGPVETCAVTNGAGELVGFSGSATVPGVGVVQFR